MSAAAATLADVLRAVLALLIAVGDVRDPDTNPGGVEVKFGERYLREEGVPPRVVFVQTKDGGSVGPVINVSAGEVASITETVRCYVWGAETSDDADRYDDANARCMRLLNAFKACAPGRLKGANMVRGQDSNVETFGEEYQLTLSYRWAVPRDDEIWAAAEASALDPPLSPPDPAKPNGDTGLSVSLGTVTFENERP